MQKKIIQLIVFLALFASCQIKESSLGAATDITIISSNKDKLESEHIIEYFFNSSFIMTPQEEKIYSLQWAQPEEINKAKLARNILFLSLSHPEDSTIDILVERIMEKNNIQDKVASTVDLFADNQIAIIFKALDTIELEKQLTAYFPWMVSEYNENIYSYYYTYIKSKGENPKLKSTLSDKFGISMFVQKDYKLIKNTDKFLWIGRGHPYRWIFFYRFNKSEIEDVFNPYTLFENILETQSVGISVYKDYKVKTKLIRNDLLEQHVYRGIYEHEESQSGGPFALYFLDNINADEVILVASILLE